MRAVEFVTEVFEPKTAFELEWDESFAPDELHAMAYDRQGRIINIGFVPISGDAVDIEFTRGGSHDITGRGDAERVFGTVLQAIQIYLSRYRQPDYVLFSGKETSRNKLYLRLVARYAARFGYKITTQDQLPEELRTMALPKDVFILAKSITNENFANARKFVKPNFDIEWEEAERYPEFVRLGKDAWIELARKGRAVTINSAQGISNTDAADPDSFKSLVPEKQKRALAQLETGTVEMPVVAVYGDGHKELIGGNTRLTAMMSRDGQATVWAFRVPDNILENFADGKVKGRSRPGRVKRAGASCAGSVSELRARAKKYGGEKGKMYHWCANMKGGRKNESQQLLTELDVGDYQVGDIIFKMTQHAIDRLSERNVPYSTVNELLRRIVLIKNQIYKLGPGQKLWAHDSSLGISLGLRLLDSGRINVGTAILGEPRNRDTYVPVIDIPSI